MSSFLGNPVLVEAVVAATPAAISVELGFKPSKVVVRNLTNGSEGTYLESMNDGELFVAGAALKTSGGLTPVTNVYGTKAGFTFGTLADFNDTATEELLFECYGSSQQ